MKKFWNILENLLLTLMVIFSLILVISKVTNIGFHTYIVKSGSMEPKIKVGSLVVTLPKKNYQVGDVITFTPQSGVESVTHRIVAVKMEDFQVSYQTKGDANSINDADLVASDSVIGAVAFTIPYLGYGANFMKTLPGFLVIIITPAILIITAELYNIYREIERIKTKNHSGEIVDVTLNNLSSQPRIVPVDNIQTFKRGPDHV